MTRTDGNPERKTGSHLQEEHTVMVKVEECHCCQQPPRHLLHATSSAVPVLNGLEEQEEEEQLLPVLPVFLLRWPWLCELSFLDFPSPSFMLWWPEDNCTKTHETSRQLTFCGTRITGDSTSDQTRLTRLPVRVQEAEGVCGVTHTPHKRLLFYRRTHDVCGFSHLFDTAARHRGAQAVRRLLVPLFLSDLVLVTLKKRVEKRRVTGQTRSEQVFTHTHSVHSVTRKKIKSIQFSPNFAASEVCPTTKG